MSWPSGTGSDVSRQRLDQGSRAPGASRWPLNTGIVEGWRLARPSRRRSKKRTASNGQNPSHSFECRRPGDLFSCLGHANNEIDVGGLVPGRQRQRTSRRDDDYDVVPDAVVNRIFLSPPAPQDRQWMCTPGYGQHADAWLRGDARGRYGLPPAWWTKGRNCRTSSTACIESFAAAPNGLAAGLHRN
jgi:hypothetical protein